MEKRPTTKKRQAIEQSSFHICQSCHMMVESVYQKGYCKKCLVKHFKGLQRVINESHAIHSSDSQNPWVLYKSI